MATSLFALLDDIATMLDDLAAMSKIAAKKTGAVVGDDLAVNAHQVSGFESHREWPVVWAVAKGALLNKLLIVPVALALNSLWPEAIHYILIAGALFLCFEGVEKIWETLHARFFAHAPVASDASAAIEAAPGGGGDWMALEQEKVRGAIRTDAILSIEIVVIALGSVASAGFWTQATVVSLIAFGMTVLVYGGVALIVKIDDAGLHLSQSPQSQWRGLGRVLLALAPQLMRTLSVVGTAAVFLVAGEILVHNVAWVGAAFHHWMAGPLSALVAMGVGVVAGVLTLPIGALIHRVLAKKSPA